MAQYVRISSEDMDSFMGALGFRELSRESRGLNVKEKVYERPFHEGRIRVYSSVEDRPGRFSAGRKVGRDAIRVQYWVGDTKVFGAKRVHRVVNWRRNMLDRVYDIEDMFGHRPVPRDSSGNLMVVRTSKNGKKFWGSCDFPRNKNTRRFNAESFEAGRKLRKESCCCGADIENPCECMYEGVMNCQADEPKCPCYAAKTEVKEAVVFAPRKATGIVDKVMMNHAMIQEVQLQQMIEYMENMVQLGLLDEEEVMAELRKTFGSEYFFDNSVEDIVMDEYLEDEDYDDAEIYARNAMKELNAEDEPMWCACGCAGKIADHDDRGYGCWPCIDCGDDSDTDINEVCSSCVGQTFTAEELTTPDGLTQEEFFQNIFHDAQVAAQEASDDPLGHLGYWFEMADEPYGGHIRDMLEKPWNWRDEMTRYLFEGGYESAIYFNDADLFALGFDASYPPYLTLKEMGELYDWMPTHEDYKGYVHNFYRAEYQEVNKSPLGVIVKGEDGKTYVLVPQDLAEIIFQQSKYVLDAEWRKEELLYSDELNDMIPISNHESWEKIYVATRNEGENIVTYIVQEELIEEEKLYRILVVIDEPLGTTHKKYLERVMDEV
tara:strand:- start:627 stop:2438 length:1812 start_codon:yes stop_codon:yes gene_type:complete